MLIPIHVQELRSRFVYVEGDNDIAAVNAVRQKFENGEMALDESDSDGRDIVAYPLSYAKGEVADFKV